MTPWLESGGILGSRSTTWDIELEDGNFPSDSSSLACDTTVVMDTGRIWGLRERMQQPAQPVVCGRPRFLTTRSPDECSCSSPRVASRFFPERVPTPSLRGDTPCTSIPDRRDLPNREPVAPTLDGYPGYPRPDIGWDDSSDQETDLFLGEYCGTHLSLSAGVCIRGS